jgi:hypothetical protein
MIQRVPVLRECSYKEYNDNIDKHPDEYLRLFVVDSNTESTEDITKEVDDNIDAIGNTDKNKFYKVLGLVSSQELEKDIQQTQQSSLLN